MSKRNKMPGLRLKGGIWQIEKRCKYVEGGWLRESTGCTSRTQAQEILIHRLAAVKGEAERKAAGLFTFEEAGLRYLEESAQKPSAGTMAMHLDQLFPFIGSHTLTHVHDGTLKCFSDYETARGMSPKSVNNALAVASAVLNKAARVWRTEGGDPWLIQAPPRLTRLSTTGRTAKPYPLSWAEQDSLFMLLSRHLADTALFTVNTGCRDQEVCQLRWEWEVEIPELKTSVFVLPETISKTSTERVVVLNAIAYRVVALRRGMDREYVFGHRGKPLYRLHNSGWKTAWRKAGLPMEKGVLRGVHNLRHMFGRRLRGAGIPRETRKLLLGHASGEITTHYSAAEIRN
ncbi:MAG: tyrosine-type recombinase/integrase [Haliea sp.]|nr:tyrosine-type recombinase/integrase [Haliea sp.]